MNDQIKKHGTSAGIGATIGAVVVAAVLGTREPQIKPIEVPVKACPEKVEMDAKLRRCVDSETHRIVKGLCCGAVPFGGTD